jgi:multicomponent Na+:H+ antiporter subunit E
VIDRLRELPRHWLGILGGVLFWCLLWQGFSVQDVLGGLLAVLLVYVLFPLPSLNRVVTLRPVAFVWFVVRFLWDLARSGAEVAWYSVRPGPQPPSSVIAVPMRSRSDLFLTITAVLCTLIPGSFVVEAQRSTGTLFLHVIGVGDDEGVQAEIEAVRRQEARALLALGRRGLCQEVGLL